MQNDSAHERNLGLGSQLGASISQRISTFPSKNPYCEQKSLEAPFPSLCSRTKWQLPIQLYSVERSDALQNALLRPPGGPLLWKWYELPQSFNLAFLISRQISLCSRSGLRQRFVSACRPVRSHHQSILSCLSSTTYRPLSLSGFSIRLTGSAGRTRSCKVGPTELFLT